MADDQDEDDKKQLNDEGHLPDEIVGHVKSEILHGVGYKRPPASGQFKKGTTGNPNGRPKKIDLGSTGDGSINALVRKEAARLITVREGDEQRQMTAIEAVHRAQYVTATKRGNAYAQKDIMSRNERAEREHRQQIAQDVQFWQRYVETTRESIADAVRHGKPAPTYLPHPDDVVIDYENGVRFLGPFDQEGVAHIENACALRDMLIVQAESDQRIAGKSGSVEAASGALLAALRLNDAVPPRYTLSDVAMMMKMDRARATAKRELLKALYQWWRGQGVPVHRGATFASLEVTAAVIEKLNEHLNFKGMPALN